MNFLGFASENLSKRDDLLKTAWYFMLGEESNCKPSHSTKSEFEEIPHRENHQRVHKRSFVILANIINNVFSPWMAEEAHLLTEQILEDELDDGALTTNNATPKKQFSSKKSPRLSKMPNKINKEV